MLRSAALCAALASAAAFAPMGALLYFSNTQYTSCCPCTVLRLSVAASQDFPIFSCAAGLWKWGESTVGRLASGERCKGNFDLAVHLLLCALLDLSNPSPFLFSSVGGLALGPSPAEIAPVFQSLLVMWAPVQARSVSPRPSPLLPAPRSPRCKWARRSTKKRTSSRASGAAVFKKDIP